MNLNSTSSRSSEIKCPHCGTQFTIDAAEYADIAQQIRSAEFEAELHARLAEAERTASANTALAVANAAQELQAASVVQEKEVERLKAELKGAATELELAVTKATANANQRLSDAENQLKLEASQRKLSEVSLKESHSKELALKEELIERYKDMKAKLSVKLLGETRDCCTNR